jgi:rhodanese-related sulfurtransferase
MRLPTAILIAIFIHSLLSICLTTNAQYKNDNVAYKTVYIEEFCKQYRSNPKAILLDVRSQGEYDDTSSSVGLNIGRIKQTKHIDIQQLPAHWRDLIAYKDQPVYVMCSHSQRSRRASKMLADSGFTNVINVNGGLTTFNLLSLQNQCKDFYETNNSYTLISPLNLCSFLSHNKDAFILDVRKDSAFKGIASEERQNAHGNLTRSENIPFEQLAQSYSKIPKDVPILVVDEFGNNAVNAARQLSQNGYSKINVLFNGLEGLLSSDKGSGCINLYWNNRTKYSIVTPIEFDQLYRKQTNLQIVDVRPAEEFNNQSKTSWRNIGVIKNAINIPLIEMENKWSSLDKSRPVLVYSFGGPDSYAAAKWLSDYGFEHVYVLAPGLFSLRWQAANLQGKSILKDWVVNIPEENR